MSRMIKALPLSSFIHGGYDAHEGRALQIDEGTFNELAAAGLVRVHNGAAAILPVRPGQGFSAEQKRTAGSITLVGPGERTTVVPTTSGSSVTTGVAKGNPSDDGQGQPSSSSDQAPASKPATSKKSDVGAKPTGKGGKSR